MAYTYDNFTQEATKAGLLSSFSEDDLKLAKTNPEFGLSILKLRQDAAKATTAEQKLLAQEAENQLRSSFAAGNAGSGTGFSFGKENEYQQMLSKVTDRDSFSYDPESDTRYGSYKKGYLREADRARADTLAKVSAATGGTPSSWAVSAADQAGSYYTGKLNDVIPTLYQDALSQYFQDYNADLSGLSALAQEREFDYNAYLQAEAQKQQTWNNALQLYSMGIRSPEVLAALGITAADIPGSKGGTRKNGGTETLTDDLSEFNSGDYIPGILRETVETLVSSANYRNNYEQAKSNLNGYKNSGTIGQKQWNAILEAATQAVKPRPKSYVKKEV